MYKQRCLYYNNHHVVCSNNVYITLSTRLNYVICFNNNTPHRLIQDYLAVYDKLRHIDMLLLYKVVLPVAVQSSDNIYKVSPSQQVVYKSTLCRLFQQRIHNGVFITTMSTLCRLFQQYLQYVVHQSKLRHLFQLKHRVVSFNIV